jgi:hypothetical protein
MQDVMDFNVAVSREAATATLVAEADCPLGQNYGTSAWPRPDELRIAPRPLGELLFSRLFPGAVNGLYQRCRGRLAEGTGKLRVRIRAAARATDHEIRDLHSIPWELLHDPHGAGFLALDHQVQLVRYLNLPAPVPGELVLTGRKLEILVASASPSDREPLRWDDEHASIERAFAGSATRVKLLRGATRDKLFAELSTQRYDVLHFIGHGTGPADHQPGTILLEDEHGLSQPVSAGKLAELLQVTRPPLLVFLNACSTAELAVQSHRDLASSVAPALALRGIPAVVGMVNLVYDTDAITFARTVYERLAQGASLEAAVHAARIAVRLGQFDETSWTIPVVFSRATAGAAPVPQIAAPPPARPQPPTASSRDDRADHMQKTTIKDNHGNISIGSQTGQININFNK